MRILFEDPVIPIANNLFIFFHHHLGIFYRANFFSLNGSTYLYLLGNRWLGTEGGTRSEFHVRRDLNTLEPISIY